MNEYPVKHGTAQLERKAKGDVTATQPNGGGFSFRYSYREVTLSGGTTRIRSREYRFEDGKLQSEEFDATTDGPVYHNAVKTAQDLVANQVSSFGRLFSALLPFSGSK